MSPRFCRRESDEGHLDSKPVALVWESTFTPGSAIHLPLWRAAVWQLPHLRAGDRGAITTTQSETFSESLPETPTRSLWVTGQLTAPTSA
jgi:hypothetical protein